ncbi:EAL domain-containing protein [Rhodoferax sp.]|uniref:EAL domain-containing protein n=1 Tax=Rhodoferax sp. TaxID=50421 RepID=UPI00374D2EF0
MSASPFFWPSLKAALTRMLGRHPRAVGLVCGYGVALGMASVLLAATLELELQRIRSGHEEVVRRVLELEQDIGGLLDELNASHSTTCSNDNLVALRVLLFSHRYARAIGLLDEQRRLFCNTSQGLIVPPKPTQPGGIQTPIGLSHFWVPVDVTHGRVRATIVERGHFSVMLEPASTLEVLNKYTDAAWAGRGPERMRYFAGPRADQLDDRQSPAIDQRTSQHLDWQRGVYVVNTRMPSGVMAFQSVLLPQELYHGSVALLAGAGVFCLLLGLLVNEVVTQRSRRFESMEYRIRYLCQADKLVCHYQPIIDLASGRAVGCEVLARLRDGANLLYPDHFIPALLKQNLGWTFDAAVSRCALHELGSSLPRGAPFKVALNFFPQNLRHGLVAPHLRASLDALQRSDLQVELEVTEYNFSPEIVPELQRLKADGYLVAIDDFGTGYSNLGMVKRVAPDYLKIDKSFVYEMEDASLRSSLIPEIIAIAKAVDSLVIAEGIENAAQAAQLQALGVPFGQGYYFAKPMPLEAFLSYLAAQRQPV